MNIENQKLQYFHSQSLIYILFLFNNLSFMWSFTFSVKIDHLHFQLKFFGINIFYNITIHMVNTL